MKDREKKPGGIVKGAPSGVIISLMVHVGAFLLAGLLVVFTVVNKKEQKFAPPKPVDRPKMKLKKPKVKVKKNAKPKSTTRIVTKVQRADMPDIQLPELGGMGTGLAGGEGLGGFDLMPDLKELTVLGTTRSIGSDLEGTYYDIKLGRRGSFLGIDQEAFRNAIIQFVEKGCKPSTLNRYYRSPNKIYATCLVVPTTQSSIAPAAFGDKDASGALWMVHYKGKLVYPKEITFRFWAAADETILVRVNGKVVVGAHWANAGDGWSNVEPDTVAPFWDTDSSLSYRYVMGNSRAAVGDWVTLKPSEPQDIDIIIGDNGGMANFYLAVEVQGVEYPKNRQGGPILPAFKTAPISRDLMDIIYKDLPVGEISLTNGPVFNDYTDAGNRRNSTVTATEKETAPAPEEPVDDGYTALRLWTRGAGDTFEAKFKSLVAGKAVFENSKGRVLKVPFEELSAADRRFVQLSRPPKFDINFSQNCNQKTFAMESYDVDNIRPPEDRCHFGVRIRQVGAGDYPFPVTAEIFVIGQERLGTKYILLDHAQTAFTPTKENRRTHKFTSDREVVLQNYEVESEPRGEKYAGYLVVLTDERGEEISIGTSDDWLYENIDNLKKLKPGNYMNKQCERVFPTRPPATLY